MIYLRILRLTALLLLLAKIASAQTGKATPFAFTSLPPSPQAAEMGRYGGLPLNLSTGAPNYSVPLYNQDIGNNIKLDMSLNYHTNGIKVKDLAGIVGLGWSFFGSGVITRIVNDDPDELSTDLAGPLTRSTPAERNIQWYEDNPLKRVLYYGNAEFYDVQPDLFSYNFFGHTGQFFLDSTQAYIIDHEGIKIEMDFWANAPWNFKVTDEYGNQFFFGSNTATEWSTIQNVATDYTGHHDQWNPSSTHRTAWFLNKFVTPTHDTVTYEYEPFGYTTINETTNSQISRQVVGTDGLPPGPDPCECAEPTIISKQIRNAHSYELSKVKVNNTTEITLDHIGNLDLTGTHLISKMKVKDLLTGQIINEINFNYLFPTYSKRPLLQKLAKCDASGGQCEEFNFEYISPELIPKRTDVQNEDYYGYFNLGAFGQREVNCPSSVIGLLSKITYPTGGHDLINYGCAQSTDLVPVKNRYTGTYRIGYGTSDHSPVEYTSEWVVPTGAFDLVLYGTATWHAPAGFDPTVNMHQIFIDVYNKRTHQNLVVGTLFRIQAGAFDTLAVPSYFYQIGDTLVLKLTSCGDQVEGEAQLAYYKNVMTSVTTYYGAGRVDRVATFDPVSQRSTIKRYKYEYNNQPGVSSGVSLNPIVNEMSYYYKNRCDFSTTVQKFRTCLYNMRSNYSQYDLYSYMPSSYLYKSVLEYEGDNGENGMTEHLFDIRIPQRAFSVYTNNLGIPSNFNDYFECPYSLYGGKISEEYATNYYQKISSGFTPVLKERKWFSEKSILRKRIGYGVQVLDNGNPGWADQQFDIKGDVKQFTFQSSWTTLDSATSTSILDDGSSYVIRKNYQYGNIQHGAPTSIRTNQGDGTEELAIMLYPHDYLPDNDFVSAMQNNHVNRYPIEQLIYINKGAGYQLADGSFTEYKTEMPTIGKKRFKLNLQNTIPQASFKISNRSLGSDLFAYTKSLPSKDSRYIQFDQNTKFDQYFKPTETVNSEGSKSSYIWGYYGKYLFAKTENATLDEVAYTSFEDYQQKGNWQYDPPMNYGIVMDSYAPTGRYVYNLAAGTAITRSNLDPNQKYVVSFFYQGSVFPTVTGQVSSNAYNGTNTYSRYEAIVGNTSNVSISFIGGDTKIDEIKIYPVTSSMETFCYDPNFGVISECKENGEIFHYTYDSKGRMTYKKDRRYNILNKIDYTVQGAQ
ncbi:hypothetical protein [Sphingobacterium detergens]|uniref:YD repeat-containing protein n=1 Tax=Sphingobacterium detergens TaxID=1145106 RepID=A0A420B6Y2_SPHD1|nr:hypothetical protein [Sphingobacterium detergens]RKE52419.1 hypothetical protein DFQ12_2655 [Sphingobacterium detergens]